MIALIDYDSGNLRSAQKALLKVGADVRVVRRPEELKDAAGVVLPGVGAFDDCVHAMQKQELLAAIRDYVKSGRPFLGFASATRPCSNAAKNSTVARRASEYSRGKWCVSQTSLASKSRKSAGTSLTSSSRTVLFTKRFAPVATSISFTAIFRSRRILRLSRRKRLTARRSLHPFGAIMSMQRSSIPKKARTPACVC